MWTHFGAFVYFFNISQSNTDIMTTTAICAAQQQTVFSQERISGINNCDYCESVRCARTGCPRLSCQFLPSLLRSRFDRFCKTGLSVTFVFLGTFLAKVTRSPVFLGRSRFFPLPFGFSKCYLDAHLSRIQPNCSGLFRFRKFSKCF